MKSGKQRKEEIAAKRLSRQEKERRKKRTEQTKNIPSAGIQVHPELLKHSRSYSIPDFVLRGYYEDKPFACKDCGKQEIWTAYQQRWWYEIAKGDIFTTATRCRACRKRERDRKTEARRIHLEGVAAKSTVK